MKGNARYRFGVRGLAILGAVVGILGCPGANKAASNGGGTPPADLAKLQERVDSLEAYRARNAAFVGKLWASYHHFYYCDNDTHKDAKICPPTPSHIQPPNGPAPQ